MERATGDEWLELLITTPVVEHSLQRYGESHGGRMARVTDTTPVSRDKSQYWHKCLCTKRALGSAKSLITDPLKIWEAKGSQAGCRPRCRFLCREGLLK
jgi:hypothetical protein